MLRFVKRCIKLCDPNKIRWGRKKIEILTSGELGGGGLYLAHQGINSGLQ